MKSFFSLRRTRYTALVMLFVWLMSLGIGIANACLVDVTTGHHASALHVQAIHHADEHSLASDKAVCFTVCAAEQTAAIKFRLLDAPSPSDSQLAPATWLPALTIAVVDLNDCSAPLMPPVWCEPPVSIRFLRLTI